ncbi:MAG: LytR/AlgR family response regulator transcription factor [Caldimonas sp.]
MKLFLVEDEAPARERLIETIARVEPDARIAGVAASVREAATWLAANPPPDLMLLDVQLADGLSFELFSERVVTCPAIFATANDEFVLEAFQANAIDYVLKPVSDDAMARGFANYRRLRAHFGADVARAAADIAAATLGRQRQRILARNGAGYVSVRLDDVAYFVSIDKSTFAVGRDGRRHLVDGTLAQLAEQLDPQRFFRVNRQVIVAAAAVLGFRPSGKGRLVLQLAPAGDAGLTVPQERAAAFRQWLAS